MLEKITFFKKLGKKSKLLQRITIHVLMGHVSTEISLK